jgi:uncharacterized membrane protein YphA (DoxX/SURF4 family)
VQSSQVSAAEESETMIRKLCTTDDKTAAVILRLVLGVVFFAHEAQKMLGWFGGYLVEGRPFGRVVLTI